MAILQMKGNIWTNVHGATAENTYNEAKEYQEDVHYGLPGGNGEGGDVNALVKVLTTSDDVEYGYRVQIDGEKLIQMLESIGVDLNWVYDSSAGCDIDIDEAIDVQFTPDKAIVNHGNQGVVYYPSTTTLKERILLVYNKGWSSNSSAFYVLNHITFNAVYDTSGNTIEGRYVFNQKSGLVTIIPNN